MTRKEIEQYIAQKMEEVRQFINDNYYEVDENFYLSVGMVGYDLHFNNNYWDKAKNKDLPIIDANRLKD